MKNAPDNWSIAVRVMKALAGLLSAATTLYVAIVHKS